MSGRTPEQEKHESQLMVQQALNLHHNAVGTMSVAQQMGPLVADAFRPGVEHAEAVLDNTIREYAYHHLGMVAR